RARPARPLLRRLPRTGAAPAQRELSDPPRAGRALPRAPAPPLSRRQARRRRLGPRDGSRGAEAHRGAAPRRGALLRLATSALTAPRRASARSPAGDALRAHAPYGSGP